MSDDRFSRVLNATIFHHPTSDPREIINQGEKKPSPTSTIPQLQSYLIPGFLITIIRILEPIFIMRGDQSR